MIYHLRATHTLLVSYYNLVERITKEKTQEREEKNNNKQQEKRIFILVHFL